MFEGIPIGDLTAPGLLGLSVLMILFGFIIPRWVYNEKKEEAEKWRLAYEAEKARADLSDAQTAELLELAKTTHKIIAATFDTSPRIWSSGGGSGNAISAS